MTDAATYPRLYGLREAAEVLGTPRTNVRKMRGVSECEYPGEYHATTPLYLADMIDALAEARKQRPQYRVAHACQADVGAGR